MLSVDIVCVVTKHHLNFNFFLHTRLTAGVPRVFHCSFMGQEQKNLGTPVTNSAALAQMFLYYNLFQL